MSRPILGLDDVSSELDPQGDELDPRDDELDALIALARTAQVNRASAERYVSDLERRLARPAAGDEMGSYRIVRQIGEGGMGVVYLGKHTILGRPAAIKVL